MTAGSIDLGESPSVLGAIIKYIWPNRGRQIQYGCHRHSWWKSHHDGTRNALVRNYINAPVTNYCWRGEYSDSQYDYFLSGRQSFPPTIMQELKIYMKKSYTRTWAIRSNFVQHFTYTLSNAVRAFWMGIKFEGPSSVKRSRVVAVHLLCLLIFPY